MGFASYLYFIVVYLLHVRHEVIVVSYMPWTPPGVSKRPGKLRFCSYGLDISNVPSVDGVGAGDCSLRTSRTALLSQCRETMIGFKLPPQLSAGQDLEIFSGIGGIQSSIAGSMTSP